MNKIRFSFNHARIIQLRVYEYIYTYVNIMLFSQDPQDNHFKFEITISLFHLFIRHFKW